MAVTPELTTCAYPLALATFKDVACISVSFLFCYHILAYMSSRDLVAYSHLQNLQGFPKFLSSE